MAKQKIEIEVELPEGFDVTGEYREPKFGEWYIDTGNFEGVQCDDHNYSLARIILRRKYVPPSWLKPGTWLFKQPNEDGWYAAAAQPTRCGFFWQRNGSVGTYIIPELFPDFVPPPTNPYQIPEAK